MEILGDLERLFATSIYPWRYPIAAAIVAGVFVVVVVAWRRGWLAAAGRHPGRVGAVIVALAVAGAPLAWYLGSPLFVRTELVEPPPAAVAEPSPPPPSAAPPAATAPPAPTPGSTAVSGATAAPSAPPATPDITATAPPVVRRGSFMGADDFHFGRGRVTLVEAADGRHTLRFDDFSVRNGPDLFVYLSPDPAGFTDGAVELGRLRATDGSFNTPIPPGTDVGAARSVVIWCREFAVLFAVATLEG